MLIEDKILENTKIARVQNQHIDDMVTAIRERQLAMIETMDINQIVLLICLAIVIVLGIAILWNQRKIKKQLKQLLEEKERNAND